jgi:hypothetical protein
VLSRLRIFLRDGFPDKSPSWQLAAYRHVSTYIIDADVLLLMGNKIIIPVDMRPAMLALIHGHLGIEKSKVLARQTLWWPRTSRTIAGTASSCAACCANRHQQSAEPLLPHPITYSRGRISVPISSRSTNATTCSSSHFQVSIRRVAD